MVLVLSRSLAVLDVCNIMMTPLIIVMLMIHIENSSQISPYGPNVVKDFVNCICDIIKSSFHKPGYLIFANTNSSNFLVRSVRSEVLREIHKSNQYIIQIVKEDEKPVCEDKNKRSFIRMDPFNGMPVADYFVTIIDDYKDFTYLTRKMIRSRFWNPYAKFVIILIRFAKNDLENHKHVENMLNCLFYYNVINVIVGIPKAQNIRNAIIYSWKPYDPPKFCGNFNETAKDRLLVENFCERGILKYNKNLFENKLPSDMHGCVLEILAIERQPFVSNNESDPNIEKNLLNSIFNKFNFSVRYKNVSEFRGERNEKGKWGGALKKLVSREGTILLGGIFPDFDVHEDFECSSSYLADSYTWVLYRAYPSPPWIALFITFHKFVWYSAIVGFLLCIFSWKILGQLSRDTQYNKSIIHCLLNSWLCLLGLCAYVRPKTQSLRVFFIFLNLYCIIFLTAYQTKLIDVLQNPTYENQVDTVEELVQSGIKFGGFEELHDLFYNSSDTFDNVVGQNWTHISNMSQALHDVVIHRNFSVLCSHLELAHLSATLPELNDGSGENNYFDFPTPTFSVPLEMIALKGFPFMKQISRYLNLYKQLGINTGVRRHFAVINMRKRARLMLTIQSEDKNFNALSIQHLQGGFFALAVGIVCGTIILLLEIVLSSKVVKNKIKQFRS